MAWHPIRLPEVTELQTFLAAAEEGSLSGAAYRLRISPTAATKRIDNLEALARAQLFERTSRGVRLTTIGRRLLPRAKQLLSEAEAVLNELVDHRPRRLEGVKRALRSAAGASPCELLVELESLLAHVFHVTTDALLITSHDGTVIEVDEAYCRLTGYGREDLVGRTTASLGLWPGPEELQRHEWIAQLKRNGEISGEVKLRTRAGEVRHASYSSLLIELAFEPCVLTRVSDVSHVGEAAQRLKTKVRRQDQAIELSLELARSTDPHTIYMKAAALIEIELRADAVALLECDEHHRLVRATAGPSAPLLVEDLCGDAQRWDTATSDGAALEEDPPRPTPSLWSILRVPLWARGAAVGELAVAAGAEAAFDDDDDAFVRMVANPLGSVLERERAERLIEELQCK